MGFQNIGPSHKFGARVVLLLQEKILKSSWCIKGIFVWCIRGFFPPGRCPPPPFLRMMYSTVLHRGMETLLMETILTFASVSPRKMETLLLGSWWP